jgi:hypothetical protein
MPRGAEDHSQDKKLPGYGGYVPGIYAKGVFGATFESAQKLAEEALSTDQQPPATGGAAEPQEFQSKAFETATEEPEPVRTHDSGHPAHPLGAVVTLTAGLYQPEMRSSHN